MLLFSLAMATPHHSLRLQEQEGTLVVSDTISGTTEVSFELQGRLAKTLVSSSHELKISYTESLDEPAQVSALSVEEGQSVSLTWTHPLQENSSTFLSSSRPWMPEFGELVTFDLELVNSPSLSVWTSGERLSSHKWRQSTPLLGVDVIIGQFEATTTMLTANSQTIAFDSVLVHSDEQLTSALIEAAQTALNRYTTLLSDYPYPRFSVIENTNEQTGLGMPGFTLLGDRVIRLPFILNSSYPHEILHNWLGNGVFVAPGTGNWCEGLTSYLADHASAELAYTGAAYRRTQLMRFTDSITSTNDYPLIDFISRQNQPAAIGYSKSLMLFHMLRVQVGDEVFKTRLRRFVRNKMYRTASFDDLVSALATEPSLRRWATHFIRTTGAPTLELGEAQLNNGVLSLSLKQTQSGPAFQTPVRVYLYGKSQVSVRTLWMTGHTASVQWAAPKDLVSVSVDPEFDSMRTLVKGEVPPTLSGVFSAHTPVYILPRAAEEEELMAYRSLIEAWDKTGEPDVRFDDELSDLNLNSWVFGKENRFARRFLISNGGEPLTENTWVLVRSTNGFTQALIAPEHPQVIAGLIRKLPHYREYGMLVFTGDDPTNTLKTDSKQPIQSPLTHSFVASSPLAAPPTRQSLLGDATENKRDQ